VVAVAAPQLAGQGGVAQNSRHMKVTLITAFYVHQHVQ
jgi:hypothetical protein